MVDSRPAADDGVVGLRRNPRDQAEEDLEEGKDRMQDEGGGVVNQYDPPGEPVLRNDLTKYAHKEQIPDGSDHQPQANG